MDYPSYLAKGWAIGSGPVEAACPAGIGWRMRGPGMRWGEEGADAMSHLRALLQSGDRQEGRLLAPLTELKTIHKTDAYSPISS